MSVNRDREGSFYCDRESSSDTEDYLDTDDRRRVYKNRMSYGCSSTPKPCLVQRQNSGTKSEPRNNSVSTPKQSPQNSSPRYLPNMM